MTTLYLVRHGATAANLEQPYRLQGRRANPPLADVGEWQAQRTTAALSALALRYVYSSPLDRARQTAGILAQPHGLAVQTLAELTECDVGAWEGLTWEAIRHRDHAAWERFEANPAEFGYPEGESFADVAKRVRPTLEGLLHRHEGEAILVVAHHVVNRVYLAELLGCTPAQAKRVKLDNCGISVVVREAGRTRVEILNDTRHLGACMSESRSQEAQLPE